MAITHERFEQGMTIEQYQEQMTQNQTAFAENIAKVTPRVDDIAFFQALPEAVNTLVITEDWCGDALANVPVLAKIAAETGQLNLRLFLRDQNLDLADQYLKEGKYRSVPVFVFFDQNMRELGYFIERPARATAEMDALAASLAAEHPELPDIGGSFEKMSDGAKRLRFTALRGLRNERSEAWNAMVLEEIEALLTASSPTR
jgi:hypothetical protein